MNVYKTPKLGSLPPHFPTPLEDAICRALKAEMTSIPDEFEKVVIESGATELKSGDSLLTGRIFEPSQEPETGYEFRVMVLKDHTDKNWLVIPVIPSQMNVK